ncbi:MAG: DUF551 domain-containing protein [Flavobacteriales bacterium]
MSQWIPVSERLPADGQRVLCFLPKNTIYLPGKTGATEERHVVVMRFAEDYFTKHPSKTGYTGPSHFWLGEGTSNRFFGEVTHWMPLPEHP